MKFKVKVGSIEVTYVTLAIIAVVLGFVAVAAYAAVSGDYVIFDKIIGFLSTAVDAATAHMGP